MMLNGERIISKPLRWAMVGGGRLSQVGYKHRIGALIRKSKIKQLTYRNLRYQEESINETILCNRQPRAFAF